MNFPALATSVMAGSFSVARWQTWFKHCIQQETVENRFVSLNTEFLIGYCMIDSGSVGTPALSVLQGSSISVLSMVLVRPGYH